MHGHITHTRFWSTTSNREIHLSSRFFNFKCSYKISYIRYFEVLTVPEISRTFELPLPITRSWVPAVEASIGRLKPSQSLVLISPLGKC